MSCVSLVCPVGYSAVSAGAAMRAGVSAFAETPYSDANGEPIVGAAVPAIPIELRGRSRLIALIKLTLEQIDAEISEQLDWGNVPVIFCSREPERPGTRLSGIVTQLEFPGGVTFSGSRAFHIGAGAASAVQAVKRARDYLDETGGRACLILAADSLIDARVLDWLDRTDRLKTSTRTDGVLPGEAACLAVVSREPLSDDHVCVHGLGVARELVTVSAEGPFRADGMRDAMKAALLETGIEMHEVDFRLSDVAGESYAFEELVLAQTRLMRKTRPSQPLWHPADCIGDCGAAAGLVQFAWAGQAFHRGYAPGPVAALHAASAFGLRTGAIVSPGDWVNS